MTAVLYQIHRVSASDSALAEHLKLITLSFDPARDTPAVMARYARPRDPSARASKWDRLTTASGRALAPILAGYGQMVSRPTGSQATGLTHRLRVHLIDAQQRIRNVYGLDFLDPQFLLADVRTLLLDERCPGQAAKANPTRRDTLQAANLEPVATRIKEGTCDDPGNGASIHRP